MKQSSWSLVCLLVLAAAPASAKQGPCSSYAGSAYGQCNAWVAEGCCAKNPLTVSCGNHLAHFQSAQCTGGQVACPACPGLACSDLGSDPNNCGACGNVCAGGSCTNGICGAPACNGPGPASFSDNFSRADGPLVSPYLTVQGLMTASIVGGEACGYDHELAIVQIAAPAHDVTVNYDFHGGTSGLETLAVAANQCTGEFVFAGLNAGGSLQIGTFGGYKVESGPFILAPNVIYHMSATFRTDGSVSVTLTQGPTVISSLSGNVGAPVDYHQAGAIIGRDVAEGLNCVDNLAIQNH